MRVVVQRVNKAAVHINHRLHSQIGRGMLLLLGVEVDDDQNDADWLCGKLSRLRIFNDAEGIEATATLTLDKLKGKFAPNYTKFNKNLNHHKDDVLIYLGTYFPRSFAETYSIFNNILQNNFTFVMKF